MILIWHARGKWAFFNSHADWKPSANSKVFKQTVQSRGNSEHTSHATHARCKTVLIAAPSPPNHGSAFRGPHSDSISLQEAASMGG